MSDFRSDGWEIVPSALTIDQCQALIDAAGDAERLTLPHRTIPAFMVALKMGSDLARPWLGDRVSGLGSYYFSRTAGYSTHRDNDFVQAIPGSFLTVWLALAPVAQFNGPLVVDGEPLHCDAGDAILLDGDLPHRSCAGFGPRPVVVLTYIKTGFPFRAGREERAEVPL